MKVYFALAVASLMVASCSDPVPYPGPVDGSGCAVSVSLAYGGYADYDQRQIDYVTSLAFSRVTCLDELLRDTD